MAIDLKIPAVGESITEVEIGEWKKAKGDAVQKDEPLVVLETDKTTVDLPSPVSGVVAEVLKQKGQTAAIGEVIARLEEKALEAKPAPASQPPASSAPPAERGSTAPQVRVTPAAQRALAEHGLRAEEVQATGPGGRLLKEDVLRQVEAGPTAPTQTASAVGLGNKSGTPSVSPPSSSAPASVESGSGTAREDESVPMSRLRRTVAERLVQAQQNAALLTTFNEIDMGAVQALRKEFGERYLAKHGTKLGLMSFFVKATVEALRLVPQVNAEIRGQNIIYHHYCDLGVAIGGGKGLVVPVLRNAERMSFAEIERAIAGFAARAKENKLTLEELQGGTFTISNGGVYGSLLSTPIVNPPQSGVLGLHAIQERPVAQQGQVVIRPMMYVALTYDHRLVDGREAVTFLKRVKEVIENPARMLLEI
jgi:2-oxoglutarate dehydrogenase E2 component (dihydrolipoamide succinyltransferase)